MTFENGVDARAYSWDPNAATALLDHLDSEAVLVKEAGCKRNSDDHWIATGVTETFGMAFSASMGIEEQD